MAGLPPSGTVTFLFSDIEGSTRLLKALRDRYPLVLERHRSLVRGAIAIHGGHEVDTQGDAFFVAFAHADQAVLCALEIQRAMAHEQWPEASQVRLRMGIHTGQAATTSESYAGLSVHRAARICAAAKGGQVLASQATRTILEDEEDEPSFELVDVGEYQLKDIARPARLFEVVHRSARAESPGGGGRAPRIVVLPFANISPDPEDGYFADGMTEELIERLAHVAGLQVIARTTSMHYKETGKTALEIGRELHAGLVLECSVRKAAERVRVTAQLIETGTEAHLWSSRYDRVLHDIFAIQDDICEQIVTAISDHLDGGGAVIGQPADGGQETTDMESYTAFLQGRELLRKKSSESTIRQALGLFELAVRLDDAFARAHVGVAECNLWLGGEGALPIAESNAKALEELAKALTLDGSLAEAHSVRALLLLGADDVAGAAGEARRAIELNPNLSDPYRTLGQIEASAGRIDEAVRLLEGAYRLDPLDINVIAFLGRLYHYAGREADALAHWARTESLVEFRTNAYRSEYHLGRNELEQAETAIREMERLRPGNGWSIMARGFLEARRGDSQAARLAIARLDALGEPVNGFLAGFVHCALEEDDLFFEAMDRALDAHQLPMLELLYSPLFTRIRDDHRFADLLRRQRAQEPSVGP